MAIAKKKQRFFDVEIPLINKTTHLRAFSVEELKDKIIKYDLTRVLRGKSLILQAVVEIKEDQPIAIPKQIILMPYYLKRMIRKGTNYVEDSFSTNCVNAQIRIKPFLITRRKVSRPVRKALREKAKEELIKYSKTKNSETIFEDIISNKLQKQLSLALKKIYPLSLCEIRILKVEKRLAVEEEQKKAKLIKKEVEEKIKEKPKEEKPLKKEKVEKKTETKEEKK